MKKCDLKEVTGKEVKGWYEWLLANDCGCCSIHFASTDNYRYCVCMGWHDLGDGPKEKNYRHWVVAWKIGRQTHNNIMQCDFDVDFEMPYPEGGGDVDDTLEIVSARKRTTIYRETKFSAPDGYRSWEALAAHMRKTARRVWKDWRKAK